MFLGIFQRASGVFRTIYACAGLPWRTCMSAGPPRRWTSARRTSCSRSPPPAGPPPLSGTSSSWTSGSPRATRALSLRRGLALRRTLRRSSSTNSRNPRHFDGIEGGRVYQALHIDSKSVSDALCRVKKCFRHSIYTDFFLPSV